MATVYNSSLDIPGTQVPDQFGYSSAISSTGSVVAIGAQYGTSNINGYVRVYQLNINTWNQLGSDIVGESSVDYSASSISLSADGTIIAIGAPGNDGTGSAAGHVRIYQYSGSAWVQLGADIDGEATSDQSGFSVSLSDNGLIVGVGGPYNNGSTTVTGHVRVFNYSGSAWVQTGSDIDGTDTNDRFGSAVSISGDGTVIAIGTPEADTGGSSTGEVQVFTYTGAAWVQVGTTIFGETLNDHFGIAVDIISDGMMIAVGASYYNSLTGRIYVYQYSAGNWVLLGSPITGDATGILFGGSVSLNGDGLIVSAGAIRSTETTGSNAGHAKTYKYTLGIWTQYGQDIIGEIANDACGASVALNAAGDMLVVGCTQEAAGSNIGYARIFQQLDDVWNQNVFVDICVAKGTIIDTDQGQICVEQIDSNVHTIGGKCIKELVKCKLKNTEHIVRINSSAISPGVPAKPLFVSNDHKILHNNKMVKAEKLARSNEYGIKLFPYDGEVVYNILMEEHQTMIANGAVIETLCPKDKNKKTNTSIEIRNKKMIPDTPIRKITGKSKLMSGI